MTNDIIEDVQAGQLETEAGHLAYHRLPVVEGARHLPGVIFLGGFKSDMTGSKAMFLQDWCYHRGLAFVRFDYFGHGISSGDFRDGTIGQWKQDALDVIDKLSDGQQILVGSSMGGWLMLLAALERPERIAGLVGVAAAPDFTEELIWKKWDKDTKAKFNKDGLINLPSCYGEEPYPITKKLIAEARKHLLLRGEMAINTPMRLLHGMSDEDVPYNFSCRIAELVKSQDVELHLVKNGGHRMSEPAQLAMLGEMLDQLVYTAAANDR